MAEIGNYHGVEDMERAMRDIEEMRTRIIEQLQTKHGVNTIDREPLESSNILGVSAELIENADTQDDYKLIVELNGLMNQVLHSEGMLNGIPSVDHLKLYGVRNETGAFIKGVEFVEQQTS